MKLSSTIEKALNDQLTLELASSYVYLGMAAHFASTPFTGFQKWMKVQSEEEVGHADKFFDYLSDRGGKVTLGTLQAPPCNYKAPIDAFRVSLAHEQKVSASICAICEMASAEKDYATVSFLKWFLDEQVEEEKNVGDMLAKLELVGENTNGLFQLDHLAAKRAEEKE